MGRDGPPPRSALLLLARNGGQCGKVHPEFTSEPHPELGLLKPSKKHPFSDGRYTVRICAEACVSG